MATKETRELLVLDEPEQKTSCKKMRTGQFVLLEIGVERKGSNAFCVFQMMGRVTRVSHNGDSASILVEYPGGTFDLHLPYDAVTAELKLVSVEPSASWEHAAAALRGRDDTPEVFQTLMMKPYLFGTQEEFRRWTYEMERQHGMPIREGADPRMVKWPSPVVADILQQIRGQVEYARHWAHGFTKKDIDDRVLPGNYLLQLQLLVDRWLIERLKHDKKDVSVFEKLVEGNLMNSREIAFRKAFASPYVPKKE